MRVARKKAVAMSWVFILLGVVLIVALALALSGRLPAVPQPTSDRFITELPDPPSVEDIDQVRFGVVFRGYRMQDVDSVLAVLRDRVAELEARKPVEAADKPRSGK